MIIYFSLGQKVEPKLSDAKLSYSSYWDGFRNLINGIGLGSDEYGTHSCRAGEATDLAPNVIEHELTISGQWGDSRLIISGFELLDEKRPQLSRILQNE